MHHGKRIRIRVLLKTETQVADFRRAFGESKIEESHFDSELILAADSGILKALSDPQEPIDVLILDINLEDPAEVEIVQRFLAKRPHLSSIIATSSKANVADLRRLMQQGFVDFLPQPFQPLDLSTAIRAAFERATIKEAEGKRESKVITLTKAAGGMGATTLAVLTAQAIDRLMNKNIKKRICVVDLDLYFGNSFSYLNVEPSANFSILNRNAERIDYDLLRSMISSHSEHIDVLAGPMSSSMEKEVSEEAVGRMLEVISENYDYIIVDLPKSKQTWSDGVVLGSDLVLVVMQYTTAAVRQTAGLLNHFTRADFVNAHIQLVLNRFSESWGPNKQALNDLEQALSQKINFIVPNDYASVIVAQNKGSRIGGRKLLESVDSMASDIIGIDTQLKKRQESFFQRLLRDRKH